MSNSSVSLLWQNKVMYIQVNLGMVSVFSNVHFTFCSNYLSLCGCVGQLVYLKYINVDKKTCLHVYMLNVLKIELNICKQTTVTVLIVCIQYLIVLTIPEVKME